MSNKYYIHLDQGEGGIFNLPKDGTSNIGTHGCMTCVCIYIPINDTQCFAAHLSGEINIEGNAGALTSWPLPPENVDSFKAKLKELLNDKFKTHQEALTQLRGNEESKDNTVIVCPWRIVGGKKGTGFYIIETLCEYFHLDKAKYVNTGKEQPHGFVVHHPRKVPTDLHYFSWKGLPPSEAILDEVAKIAESQGPGDQLDRWNAACRGRVEGRGPADDGWKPITKPQQEQKVMDWSLIWSQQTWMNVIAWKK